MFEKRNQHSGNPTLSMNTNSKGGMSGLKKGNDRNAKRNRKLCRKCGHFHGGEGLECTNAFYKCYKSAHIIKDCQNVKNQAKVDTQSRSNPTAASEPPKRNQFYALKGREE